MGQGLGAITILNGQRSSVSEQSPIKLTAAQIRTKGSYRSPRKVRRPAGQILEPNTAGPADPHSAKIPEYHNESDFSSNSDTRNGPNSTFATPATTENVVDGEAARAKRRKNQYKNTSRQSMASSPHPRDQNERANAPVKAQQMHRTPNVVRKGQIQMDTSQGPIIPGFSMMHKTVNASKQFES